MDIKTVICPNCGASASNFHNCEYCGSFLVQKASQGFEMSEYVKIARTVNVDGLCKVLKKLTDIIKREPYSDLCVVIDGVPCLSVSSFNTFGGTTDKKIMNSYFEGIYINIERTDEMDDLLMRKFKNSRAFAAFQKTEFYNLDNGQVANVDLDVYDVEFGFDYEGASKVVGMLLADVYGTDMNTCIYRIQPIYFLPEINHYAEYNAQGDFIGGFGDGKQEFASCQQLIADIHQYNNTNVQQTIEDSEEGGTNWLLVIIIVVFLALGITIYGVCLLG